MLISTKYFQKPTSSSPLPTSYSISSFSSAVYLDQIISIVSSLGIALSLKTWGITTIDYEIIWQLFESRNYLVHYSNGEITGRHNREEFTHHGHYRPVQRHLGCTQGSSFRREGNRTSFESDYLLILIIFQIQDKFGISEFSIFGNYSVPSSLDEIHARR